MNDYDFSIHDFVQGCPLQIFDFLVLRALGIEPQIQYSRSWRKNHIKNSFKKN